MRSERAWPLKLKLALCSVLVFIVGAGSVAWYVVRELREDFESLLRDAGFTRCQCWTDAQAWFAVFAAA